jgi:hypothetical protein
MKRFCYFCGKVMTVEIGDPSHFCSPVCFMDNYHEKLRNRQKKGKSGVQAREREPAEPSQNNAKPTIGGKG